MLRYMRFPAAVLIAIGGYTHYDLLDIYPRGLPGRIHDQFLANVVVSAIVVIALLVTNHIVARLAGLALAAGSLVAFALSRGPGLFGFKEKGWEPSPHAAWAVFTEIGVVVLLGISIAVERRKTAPS